jgi:phage terminase large subunit-like protein
MYDPASEERTWADIKESSGVDSRDQIKYLANKNFGFFVEHVLGANVNSPVIQKSIDFHQNPQKYSKTDSGTDAVKAAVMAPRGHSKTYSWTIFPILWVCYKESGSEIILSSASHTQSKDILQDIKRIIARNSALHHLESSTENLKELDTDIDDWEGSWSTEEIVTTTDVQVQIKTFSDSIRSSHVDYVFLDDVLSNDMKIEKEKDVFYSTLSPIIENSDGMMQIVGTPLDYNDLMMELMEKDNFYTERYQAYDTDTEKVLWPDNWTYDALMEKKKEIGPARFVREYMTNPMSVDEQFFDDHVIESSFGADWLHNPHDGSHDDWNYFLGVDVALQDGADADYTVFTILGQGEDGQIHLVNMEREKGMSPSTIAGKINDLDNFYHFNGGLVEKNAIGEGVWKTIEEECSVIGRIEPFDTTRKTRPEILSSLQAALGRGELLLHDFDPLVREMRGFHMNKKGKLEGREHDDTVMSLAIAFRVLDEGASQASFNIIGDNDEDSYQNKEVDNAKESSSLSSSQDSSPDVKLGIV